MAHETTSGFVGNFRHKIRHGLVSDSATTELQFQPAQLGPSLLYKVYMGLMIKITIPSVPPFNPMSCV